MTVRKMYVVQYVTNDGAVIGCGTYDSLTFCRKFARILSKQFAAKAEIWHGAECVATITAR